MVCPDECPYFSPPDCPEGCRVLAGDLDLCGCRSRPYCFGCPNGCEDVIVNCRECNRDQDCMDVGLCSLDEGCVCSEHLCIKNEEQGEDFNETDCPLLTPPADDFCEDGEVKTQYDDNDCVVGYKCMKKLSNGRDAEIKIMPETASERAIERLGELDFTVELKEVGKGDDIKAVYEVKAKKQGKFLGLFKIKGEVIVNIDSETGEVVSVKKPWWSFLASGI